MTRVAIKLKNIHFRYPGSNIKQLNGITLDIIENQITFLVGKLGSGKSLLLKHINGIHKPQKGSVVVRNRNGEDIIVSEGKGIYYQEIGFLFENPEEQIFYPVVAEDIAFGPRNLNLSKTEIKRRVFDAASQVDILHLLERETISLSLGEKTLVALAGILAMEPQILLLDSPGLGLDLWTKPQIIELLQNLSNYKTIIIASNDPEFLQIADRIFLIDEGKIKGKYKSYKTFTTSLKRRKDELSKDDI